MIPVVRRAVGACPKRLGRLWGGVSRRFGRTFATLRLIERIRALTREHAPRVSIVLPAMGLIGDNLQLGALCSAIRRSFPDAFLVVLVSQKITLEYWEQHPAVDRICYDPSDTVVRQTADWLLALGLIDMAYEYRYALSPKFSRNSRVPSDRQDELIKAFASSRPENYARFPLGNNILTDRWPGPEGLLQLIEDSSTLGLRPLEFGLAPSDVRAQRLRARMDPSEPYLTIHAGSSPSMGIAGQQTKNWSPSDWNELLRHLRDAAIKIYQIGIDGEPDIEGADLRFKGQLTLLETAEVLRGARLHIDTEGGIVHLARAVGSPSVVLFGPTPASFFGYAENTNLPSPVCSPCWWSTPDWHKRCPLGFDSPPCMAAHDAGFVAQTVSRLLAAP